MENLDQNLKQNYKFIENYELKDVAGIGIKKIFFSNKKNNNFEIVYCETERKPQTSHLRSIWKERRQGTAIPLIVVCKYDNYFSLCGPVGTEPPVYEDLKFKIINVICNEALEKENYPLALRNIKENLASLNTVKLGVNNEGLFSDNVLKGISNNKKNWSDIINESRKLKGKIGEDLLKTLGYQIDDYDKTSFLLRVSGKKKALAVLLKSEESIDIQNQRFGNLSPIANTFIKADNEGIPFIIVCTDNSFRLYPTEIGIGVGSRSRVETYIHFNLNLLEDDDYGLLSLICSSESIRENGNFYQLLEDSKRFSGNLAFTIREKIQSKVIPLIAKGIREQLINSNKLRKEELEKIYNLSLLVVFRVIFIAYSEDKDLLPYKNNDLYRKRSLKNIALELLELRRTNQFQFDASSIYWDNLRHLFNAINYGNKTWNVPAYNGGLFNIEHDSPFYYNDIEDLKITDNYLAPALCELLIDEKTNGPVDFRSLGVKEFGNIYEGLIDSSLNIALSDLKVDTKGKIKVVDKNNKSIDIFKGDFYLTNNSGFRKSSGSHFTKTFIVENLLENSLNSSIDDHFKNLDSLNDLEASEKFFDFKVADIAMGSGHFLVSAVDFIEIKFSKYLAKRNLKKVIEEIEELKVISETNLNNLSGESAIDDSQILRRLIARKCIYGIDLNPISVQLSRLAIWIHTFIPGLPLSFLDHNLVQGNSLVGIGNFEEVKEKLISDQNESPLFFDDPSKFLEKSIEPFKKLSRLKDATLDEVKFAKKAKKEMIESTITLKSFFDLITVLRINNEPLDLIPLGISFEELDKDLKKITSSSIFNAKEDEIKSLKPFHFPIAFPEVYLRDNPGFDLIVGNPPWEEVTVEKDAFWARHFPGLHAMNAKEKKLKIVKLENENPSLLADLNKEIAYTKNLRKVLLSGEFKGMGSGDPDLYKGFCWRFLKLINNLKGVIAVVLPRDAFNTKGSTDFRNSLFYSYKNIRVTFLLNNKHWVFDDVHAQFTVALLIAQKKLKQSDKSQIFLPKVVRNLKEFNRIKYEKIFNLSLDQLSRFNKDLSLPTLKINEALEIISKMSRFSRIGGEDWNVIPYSELHATNDREYFNFDFISGDKQINTKKYWPVIKGETFQIWEPDTKRYYAHADSKVLTEELFKRRLRASGNKKSVFSTFPKEYIRDRKTLHCLDYRIAFRNVTNRTNNRTFISSILPKNVFIPNFAPYLIQREKSYEDMVYLIGIFNSIPFDWYVRSWVEINMNFFIFENFPVPKFEKNNYIFKEIIKIAGRLSCINDNFKDLADSIKIKITNISDEEKNELIYYLDALVCKAYNLSSNDIKLIYKSFHETWDYTERLNKVLEYFKKI